MTSSANITRSIRHDEPVADQHQHDRLAECFPSCAGMETNRWNIVLGLGNLERNASGERDIQATQSSIAVLCRVSGHGGGFKHHYSGRFDHYTDYRSSFSWKQGVSYRTPCTGRCSMDR